MSFKKTLIFIKKTHNINLFTSSAYSLINTIGHSIHFSNTNKQGIEFLILKLVWGGTCDNSFFFSTLCLSFIFLNLSLHWPKVHCTSIGSVEGCNKSFLILLLDGLPIRLPIIFFQTCATKMQILHCSKISMWNLFF